jgi:RNA polymerase sigma-70 factor (ECF subfamily)
VNRDDRADSGSRNREPLEPATEAALVSRAQQGQTGAFEQLYRQHVGKVYAVCLRLVPDVQKAETLTQDVFVRAWQKLDTYAGRGPFGAWLRRLAVNVVIEAGRADARRQRRLVALEEAMGDTDPRLPAVEADSAADWQLERAVAALPDGARLAFVLHDVQGYRCQEIAALTGVSVGTIKSQLHRARRLLREMLALHGAAADLRSVQT